MIRQNKKSTRTRVIILLVLYAVLVPFSTAWYGTIISIDCNVKHSESSLVKTGSSSDGKQQNCLEQKNFHWIKFYGINGTIYGTQLAALIMTVKRKDTN